MTSNAAPRPDQSRETVPGARLTLAVSCLGFFVTVLGSTVVNIAVPTIGRQLGGNISDFQWVVDAYTLMFAALLLSAGSLSDRVGASRLYLIGLSVFTAASVVSGLAPNFVVLIVAQAVQGAAAAVVVPTSLALIRQTFPDSAARAKGVALWTAIGGIAIAGGPIAGGGLTSALGWRYVFFLNVPIGLIGLLALLRVPRSRPRPAPLDGPGQLTIVLALAALTFAMIEAGGRGFGSLVVIVALLVFVLATAAFLVAEIRSDHPAVPLDLFRSPTVSVCVLVGFALNFSFYGIVFVFSLFFQQLRGASPLTAGLMFVPMTAFVTVMSLVTGRLTARFGPRWPLIVGQFVQAVDLLVLITVGRTTPTAVLLLLLVPMGIGGGTAIPAMTSAFLEAVDASRYGLASGLLNASRQLGGALAVAVFGTLVGSRQLGFADGMRLSLLIGGILVLGTCIATFLFVQSPAERPANVATAARHRHA